MLRVARNPAALGALATLLAGCLYAPSTIEGMPVDASWVALPLRGWITEGSVAAEGIVACLAPGCARRVGVGVFRVAGAEARTVAAALRDPQVLVRFIEARDAADTAPRRRAIRTVVSAAPIREGSYTGFVLTLSQENGARPVHAAVLGLGAGDPLRFAIVIGESRDPVELTIRELAARAR